MLLSCRQSLLGTGETPHHFYRLMLGATYKKTIPQGSQRDPPILNQDEIWQITECKACLKQGDSRPILSAFKRWFRTQVFPIMFSVFPPCTLYRTSPSQIKKQRQKVDAAFQVFLQKLLQRPGTHHIVRFRASLTREQLEKPLPTFLYVGFFHPPSSHNAIRQKHYDQNE